MASGCGCYGYVGGCGDVVGGEYVTDWADESVECQADCCTAAMTLEPRGLERLGRIPNEIELTVGAGDPNANRPGR
jgi:hypothetical protein